MTIDDGSSDTIAFLGTAGARFMVSKQITTSGGMWFDLSGTQILVDPGPGSIVQSTKRKLNAEKLSQETGIKIIAAHDGMKFDLAQLDGEGKI